MNTTLMLPSQMTIKSMTLYFDVDFYPRSSFFSVPALYCRRAIAVPSASASASVSASACKMFGQMLKSWNFSLSFFCILTLHIILIKPLTINVHDRCASDDCGNSGLYLLLQGAYNFMNKSCKYLTF